MCKCSNKCICGDKNWVKKNKLVLKTPRVNQSNAEVHRKSSIFLFSFYVLHMHLVFIFLLLLAGLSFHRIIALFLLLCFALHRHVHLSRSPIYLQYNYLERSPLNFKMHRVNFFFWVLLALAWATNSSNKGMCRIFVNKNHRDAKTKIPFFCTNVINTGE